MVIYTLQSILIFAKRSEEAREFLFIRQNVVMFCLHFVAFMVLYLQMNQSQILFFYGEQALYRSVLLWLQDCLMISRSNSFRSV